MRVFERTPLRPVQQPDSEWKALTERLEADDAMKWVGLMNTLKVQAEEIILSKFIYL